VLDQSRVRIWLRVLERMRTLEWLRMLRWLRSVEWLRLRIGLQALVLRGHAAVVLLVSLSRP